MYILDIIETCRNASLSTVLPVVKSIMLIIQIAVPTTLIISFAVEFTKLSVNPEDKNGFRKLLNKIIAAVIVFLLPVLINVVFDVVGDKTDFSQCWNNTSAGININGNYKE